MSESCKDRILENYNSRIEDLKKFSEVGYGETEVDDIGCWYDYGLGFDYVHENTFGKHDCLSV